MKIKLEKNDMSIILDINRKKASRLIRVLLKRGITNQGMIRLVACGYWKPTKESDVADVVIFHDSRWGWIARHEGD